MSTLLTAYLVFALLLIILAIPLIYKRIKPNPFYGFRVTATLHNEDLWYTVNQLLGKWLLASAVIFLITAVGLYFVPGITLDQYSLGSLAGFALPFVIGLVFMFRYFHSLTR